jgi:hypothetical protein
LLRNYVRSDMSKLGAKNIWEMPLESGLEVRYTWLTSDKAGRLDMSDLTGVFGGMIDF